MSRRAVGVFRWVSTLLALALLSLTPSRARADGPKTVTVGIYVNQLLALDLKNNSFTVDFYLWFRWSDDALHPADTFELPAGRVLSKTSVGKKKIGSENYASLRIVATIAQFWDMRRYPLDDHTLRIEVEDAESEAHALVFVADRSNEGVRPEVDIPGWHLGASQGEIVAHEYSTNYGDVSLPSGSRSQYSRYRYSLELARPGRGRFVKTFFGLFVSALVAWAAFFVRPKDSSPRVSLGVGATFAACAVTVAINNSMPDTNAVTMADRLVMLTLGSIVASVGASIFALRLHARGDDARQERLDRLGRWAFPLLYALGLALITR
jgi:hypothetical protein